MQHRLHQKAKFQRQCVSLFEFPVAIGCRDICVYVTTRVWKRAKIALVNIYLYLLNLDTFGRICGGTDAVHLNTSSVLQLRPFNSVPDRSFKPLFRILCGIAIQQDICLPCHNLTICCGCTLEVQLRILNGPILQYFLIHVVPYGVQTVLMGVSLSRVLAVVLEGIE